MITNIQIAMAASLFVLGLTCCVAGFWTMLSRQYQQTLHSLSAHSARVTAKALTDTGLVPLVEALSNLVKAVDQLVRTSMGVGAFLCLAGATLCAVAYWMITGL